MGKKDKKKGKGQGAEKTAAKTEKKLSQKLKKELALKGEEDIESILAKFTKEDKEKVSVIEEVVSPPSKRSSFSLTAHPDKDQLILFGGEYFNGNKTFLFNDLYFYNIKQDRWLQVISPGGPPPRSSHQAVALSQSGGQLWVFGGEFTSPSQSQFYHYKDLWVFHFNSKTWEKVSGKGTGPSSRSGHRMISIKKQLIIFGGFHDNTRDYKYFNDVHIFNLEDYSWHKIEPSGNGPSPRSGCQMMPVSDGRLVIYGGYSKVKGKKDSDIGVTHSEMFTLVPDKHDTTGLKWKWVAGKQTGSKPDPRCAFSMSLIVGDKAVMFGGVYDAQEDEEELDGQFFNDLHQLDLTKLIWHQMNVTGKKEECDGEKKKRRRAKKEEMETEEESTDEKMEEDQQKEVYGDGVFTVTVGPSSGATGGEKGVESKQLSDPDVFTPPPRINPGLAVKKGILYLYGGMYEEGDKQLTLSDFYSLDLSKLEEWNTIIQLNAKDMEWFDSDSSGDEDEDEDEDDDEDDEEDEEDGEDGEGSPVEEMDAT